MKKFVFCLLVVFTQYGSAAVDAKRFNNQEQEKSYNDLISELRCLVCQNQNIADSNAALAKDLRRQVYEMIQQGKSRQEVTDYMLARYGDFVLYRPSFKLTTALLWVGPFVFLLIGIIVVVMYIRLRKKHEAIELSNEQQEKMRSLLENKD